MTNPTVAETVATALAYLHDQAFCPHCGLSMGRLTDGNDPAYPCAVCDPDGYVPSLRADEDDCTCEHFKTDGPCPVPHCIVCGDAATTTDLDGEHTCQRCADELVVARRARGML